MGNISFKLQPVFKVVIILTAWFALGLQLYIMIDNVPGNGLSVPGAIIQFLSFFTVLSNILVAATLSISLLNPSSSWGRFFSRPAVQTAIAVYIVIVGIVYNLVLRNLWSPQGLQLIADELLHVAVPLLYLLFWLIFVAKGVLKWKNAMAWLLFPLFYFIYTMIRGSFTGWYPYPFINAAELGYSKLLLNVTMILAAFLAISLLFIAINRSMKNS